MKVMLSCDDVLWKEYSVHFNTVTFVSHLCEVILGKDTAFFSKNYLFYRSFKKDVIRLGLQLV